MHSFGAPLVRSVRVMLTRRSESGYTLVALLALMTVLMLAVLAAAPSIQQQNQRALEQEAIYRGEQVAEAIRLYVRARGVLPTSMDQLLEGIPVGFKKRLILRASAVRDPLSGAEWRLITPTSREFFEFQRGVTLYAGGVTPPPAPRDPLLQRYAVQIISLVNTRSTETNQPHASPGSEDGSASTLTPFIGVSSRSKRRSVINYYGIDRHSRWVFTPLFR